MIILPFSNFNIYTSYPRPSSSPSTNLSSPTPFVPPPYCHRRISSHNGRHRRPSLPSAASCFQRRKPPLLPSLLPALQTTIAASCFQIRHHRCRRPGSPLWSPLLPPLASSSAFAVAVAIAFIADRGFMMSLLLPSDGNSSSSRHRLPIPCYSSLSGFCDPGIKVTTGANTVSLCYEETKERIRKLFDKVQLSVSSYDTAWVALVPSPNFSDTPCFPECIDWLLNNQLSDGSWGLPNHNPLLIKDALSSTLASVLALKRWCVGEEQINKGLHFIELNATSAADENQHSPIGFDIIFPGMLEYAKDLGLNLPFESKDLNLMLERRELDVKRSRSEGRTAYLAYMSEGIGKLQDWDMAMKYQRKNGSLFNSPSTTAAAFLHLHNADCLNYLHMLLEKFGNAVPTVYPLDIYARLCMIDSLERLGIDRYFRQEIRSVLDETYRSWLQGEEQIFLDTATCAMAFRILRLNGYNVSSDPLTKITKGEHVNFPSGHLGDIGGVLELYRASQIMIHPDESTLEKELSWSTHFLKEKSYNHRINSDIVNEYVIQEVMSCNTGNFQPHLFCKSANKYDSALPGG